MGYRKVLFYIEMILIIYSCTSIKTNQNNLSKTSEILIPYELTGSTIQYDCIIVRNGTVVDMLRGNNSYDYMVAANDTFHIIVPFSFPVKLSNEHQYLFYLHPTGTSFKNGLVLDGAFIYRKDTIPTLYNSNENTSSPAIYFLSHEIFPIEIVGEVEMKNPLVEDIYSSRLLNKSKAFIQYDSVIEVTGYVNSIKQFDDISILSVLKKDGEAIRVLCPRVYSVDVNQQYVLTLHPVCVSFKVPHENERYWKSYLTFGKDSITVTLDIARGTIMPSVYCICTNPLLSPLVSVKTK